VRSYRQMMQAVEGQIRDAQYRGDLTNLPGAGKPLRQETGPHDGNWWAREYVKREGLSTDLFLPPGIVLKKEIGDLPQRLLAYRDEQHVRDHLDDLNRRIRAEILVPSTQAVIHRQVDVEVLVEDWRSARAELDARPAPPPPPEPPKASWWRRLFTAPQASQRY
jgi:hypothetical protein